MTIPTFVLMTMCALAIPMPEGRPVEKNPSRFIAVREFDSWTRTPGDNSRQTVLTSPPLDPGRPWDDLVASWNATAPPGAGIRIEARALMADRATRFYTLGLWSSDPGPPAFDKVGAPTLHPRESINNQKDADGDVQTDTLVLARPAGRVEIRVTLTSSDSATPALRFLGLSFLDRHVGQPAESAPKRSRAWGKTLDVPERAQGAYPHGSVICSPTCTSMALSFWSKILSRPDLDKDVPEVVEGVYDRTWGGTGNWPFNTAYAGSFPGIRAYVTRFTSISEIESWIEVGIPVVCSVSYNLLRGRPRTGSDDGHLVVCVGFTKEGDPILNDPALNPKRGLRVRTPYPRKRFESGWGHSRNTVYLIYPERHRVPSNNQQHWAR